MGVTIVTPEIVPGEASIMLPTSINDLESSAAHTERNYIKDMRPYSFPHSCFYSQITIIRAL